MGKSNYLELVAFALLSICVSAFSSCTGEKGKNKEVVYETLNMIEHYDDEDEYTFYRCKDSVYMVSGANLHIIYEYSFADKYRTYDMFKDAYLDGSPNIGLTERDIRDLYVDSFLIDSSILDFYNEKGLDCLLETYCDKDGDKVRVHDFINVDYDKRRTIGYCLWLNGYFPCYSDIYFDEFYLPKEIYEQTNEI